MVRRALVLGLLALAGCGGEQAAGSGLDLTLLVQGAVPADNFRVRIFGAAVGCLDVLAHPADYDLDASAVCAAGEADSSKNCLLAFNAFSASQGDAPINNLSPGQRAVFVEGVSNDSGVVSHGCAAVTIQAGKATSVSITVQ